MRKETSQNTVMDERGRVAKRQRVAGIRGARGCYRQPLKAVVEASCSREPMHHRLDEVAEEVVPAHPGKVRAVAEARVKTDKIRLGDFGPPAAGGAGALDLCLGGADGPRSADQTGRQVAALGLCGGADAGDL